MKRLTLIVAVALVVVVLASGGSVEIARAGLGQADRGREARDG